MRIPAYRKQKSGVRYVWLVGLVAALWALGLLSLHEQIDLSTAQYYFPTERLSGKQVATVEHVSRTKIKADVGATAVYGTYLRFSDKTEGVYALPTEAKQQSSVSLVLLLHACTHSALKFFSPSEERCNKCVGLSEELQIARILLKRGYAVLAITSKDRRSGCWSDSDVPLVRNAVIEFQKVHDHVQWSRKIIAVGASSGGWFAARLTLGGVAQAALVMVSGLRQKLRHRYLSLRNPPPVYLAPMPRDKHTTKAAREDYETIVVDENNPPPLVLDVTTCVAKAVTTDYLHDRVPNVSMQMADSIVSALIHRKHLNATDHFLIQDPTRSDWRVVLQEECGSSCLHNQPLTAGFSPLAKALHRAWAFHEYCSEVVPVAFDFFETKVLESKNS